MTITQDLGAARIQLHLDVHSPIELVEMTLSFQALAYEYKDYLKKRFGHHEKALSDIDSIKLYITRIENNCILAELAGASMIMGQLFSSMDYINIFVDFVRNISDAINYFRDLSKQKTIEAKDIPYTKAQCTRYADLLKIAAENKNGYLGISAIEYQDHSEESSIQLSIRFDSDEAYEGRKGALLSKEALRHRLMK